MTDSATVSPKVGVVMGSRSDWETLAPAMELLALLEIPAKAEVVSAHRTPEKLFEYARTAEEHGLQCIIAGAGGAAHLPGMIASLTILPVFGVPVRSRALNGLDSLLSIVQMPAGIPVPTLAIGESGARNAALSCAAVLALGDPDLRERLRRYREDQTRTVIENDQLP